MTCDQTPGRAAGLALVAAFLGKSNKTINNQNNEI